MNTEYKSFDEKLKRLGEITAKLEQGKASLDESMALYEEGRRLADECAKLLNEAELKVTLLKQGPDGTCAEVPFLTEGE